MSAHWVFNGGKKVTESVYIPEKRADDEAADDYHQTVSFNGKQQRTIAPVKKSYIYQPSSYIYPGTPVEQNKAEQPLQVSTGEEYAVIPKTPAVTPKTLDNTPETLAKKTPDGEADASQVDPQTFIDEFRRKQAELELMVERFCSVTAIKSESHSSFRPPTDQPQPPVSKVATPSPIAILPQQTVYNPVTAAPTPQLEVKRAPAVSFRQSQPMVTRSDNRPVHKKRINEPSQYLGSTLNELYFAFDKPTDPWAAAAGSHRAVEEAVYQTTEEQPTATPKNVNIVPRREPHYDPSEYHF